MAYVDDIEVEIAILLGAADMPIGQVLEISRGAMISLDRGESEPSLLLVNGKLVARGQVLVNGERMALEISEMVTEG